jgi:hypothetical protein
MHHGGTEITERHYSDRLLRRLSDDGQFVNKPGYVIRLSNV